MSEILKIKSKIDVIITINVLRSVCASWSASSIVNMVVKLNSLYGFNNKCQQKILNWLVEHSLVWNASPKSKNHNFLTLTCTVFAKEITFRKSSY